MKCFWRCHNCMFTSSPLSFSWHPRKHFTQIFSAKFAANYTTLENRCVLKDQRTLPIVFNHFSQVLSWLTEIKITKTGFLPIEQGKKPTNQKRLVPIPPIEHDQKWHFYCLISHRAGAWHYRIFLTTAVFTWAWLTGLAQLPWWISLWVYMRNFIPFPRCEKAKDPGD